MKALHGVRRREFGHQNSMFSIDFYRKEHVFTWRFDTSAKEAKVTNYQRKSKAKLLGLEFSEEQTSKIFP